MYRVLLSEEPGLVRDGLACVIDSAPDLTLTAEACGDTVVQVADDVDTDVLVMGIGLREGPCMDSLRTLSKLAPDLPVIVLVHPDRMTLGARLLESGARGCLSLTASKDELREAIREVSQGRIYVDRRGTASVLQSVLSPKGNGSGISLTERERQVLCYTVEGMTTKRIANELGLSVKTVETHRHKVMKKLEIFNIAGLTKYAIRQGLTSV